MSFNIDLELAYHMGYDDALAKRKPDASKTEVLASGDLAAENAKLRELMRDMHKALFSLNLDHCQACPREDACVFMHKSFDCDECAFERDMRELGVEGTK